jgi:hypothetical protein
MAIDGKCFVAAKCPLSKVKSSDRVADQSEKFSPGSPGSPGSVIRGWLLGFWTLLMALMEEHCSILVVMGCIILHYYCFCPHLLIYFAIEQVDQRVLL